MRSDHHPDRSGGSGVGERPVPLRHHLRVEEQVPGREQDGGERDPGRRTMTGAGHDHVHRVAHHRPRQRDHGGNRTQRGPQAVGGVFVGAEREPGARPDRLDDPPEAQCHGEEPHRPREGLGGQRMGHRRQEEQHHTGDGEQVPDATGHQDPQDLAADGQPRQQPGQAQQRGVIGHVSIVGAEWPQGNSPTSAAVPAVMRSSSL